MKKMNRRKFLLTTSGILITAGGLTWYKMSKKPPLGIAVDDELIQSGQKLLNQIIAIDIHAHPGRSFVEGAKDIDFKFNYYELIGRFEDKAFADMRKGGVTVSTFSTVSDYQILTLGKNGLSVRREFKPNEAWNSYQTQIKTLKSLISDDVKLILNPDDIYQTKKENKIGTLFSAEGSDFLQGDLDKLDTCYEDGIRCITLMHYHVNKVGDIQTHAPVHKSLTPFGISLIKKMNQKGIIIDLAHAHKQTLTKALGITQKPVMISHALIRHGKFDHPRFIDLEDAKRVAQTGGIVGVWPAGLGLHTLSDYIDQIFRQIDDIGIDHVALGTDMDANYKPVFYNYTQAPILAGTLLKRGLSQEEAAKILGGNFIRFFNEVVS